MNRETITAEIAFLEEHLAFWESRLKVHRNRIDELNQQLADLDCGAVRESQLTQELDALGIDEAFLESAVRQSRAAYIPQRDGPLIPAKLIETE